MVAAKEKIPNGVQKYVPQRYKFLWGTKGLNGVLYPQMGYGWQPCSTATEVIGHADSEYTVIFYRELIPQNSSTVIWNSILSQIAISFFTF